jgi:hypothetical protein
VPGSDEISSPKSELCQKKKQLCTLCDKRPFHCTAKNWLARFRTGHLSTEGECSGRLSQVTISENLDAVHSMTLEDQRISAKKMAETLVIS